MSSTISLSPPPPLLPPPLPLHSPQGSQTVTATILPLQQSWTLLQAGPGLIPTYK